MLSNVQVWGLDNLLFTATKLQSEDFGFLATAQDWNKQSTT
jgi:hypothetical protein